MNNQLVSIIVPVFNVREFLKPALNSIQNQTYKNIEVILVDDGSTDNSQAILKEYCIANANAKLVIQENKGLAGARNTGYLHAKGELLYFFDSDDLIDPTTIEKLANAIVKNNVDMSCCSFKKFTNEQTIQYNTKPINEKILYHQDNIALYLMKSILYDWMTWNKMYKKEIIKQVFADRKPFNEDVLFGEDAFFFLEYMTKVEKAAIIKNKLYFYRQRKSSLVHQVFSKRQITFLDNNHILQKLAEQYPKAKYVAYDKFAHQFREFVIEMIINEWNIQDINKAFQLYLLFFPKAIKNRFVPLYRKIDLLFLNPWFKLKVKRYLKKHF